MASGKPLLIALALGLLAPTVVLAQASAVSWPNVVLKYATDGTPILQSRVPLASTAAGGGAATLNASQRLAIGNAMANLQLTRNVPLANVAKVARVASFLGGPAMLLGLALTGLEWLGDHWALPGEYDPMAPSAGVSGLPYEAAPVSCYIASRYFYTAKSSPPFDVRGVVTTAEKNSLVAAGWLWANNCGGWHLVYAPSSYYESGAPVGEAASEAQLESGIASALQAQPSLAGQVLDAALQDAEARAQLAAGALGVSGPATVDGGTTTSTRVDTAGTTTIQTQTTYNLSYQGDTVNLTQTNVETVTDPANNVTTTTTTTDTPAGDPPPPEEPPDLCAENPDASGCAPFGTPEPPTPLPQEDRTVSVAPEMSAAGACPAPQSFSIAGQSFQLTYDGACEFAQGIRPVVLAVAWMGAFVFLFSIGRAQTS